ncbi:hypothetical protein MAR_024407, partial [Mya arenaria]
MFCKCFIWVILLSVLYSLEAKVVGKSEGKIRAGRVKNQELNNGLAFSEEISVNVEMEGKPTNTVTLRKANIDTRRVKDVNTRASAVYFSEDKSMIYREDCSEDGACRNYALIRNENEAEFISANGKVLEIHSNEGALR